MIFILFVFQFIYEEFYEHISLMPLFCFPFTGSYPITINILQSTSEGSSYLIYYALLNAKLGKGNETLLSVKSFLLKKENIYRRGENPRERLHSTY